MDFRFTPEEEAFRGEFTSWLTKTLAPDYEPDRPRIFETPQELARAYRNLQARMFESGYTGMHFPKEYGGQGRTLAEEIIVLETLSSMCMEMRFPGVITFGMAAPTLLMCGNEEQKKEFITKMFDGTHIWCQGFSEPNAGSDVANVSTTAVRDGDHYVVNGQKVWTSYAHISDYCLLLVRTDPATAKHRGLSYLLVDMKTPGVEVRPIRQITGESEFNEVYFEDARVPADMLVGEEGAGWRIAITTLMFERVIGDAVMAEGFGRRLKYVMEAARNSKRGGRQVSEDSEVRQKLMRAWIEIQVLKCHGYRNLSRMFQGGIPGPEGSIGKLLWSQHSQRTAEATLEILGPESMIQPGSDYSLVGGSWVYTFLRSKGNTIEAGTTEIQRNIIGERVLGLPKDATPGGPGLIEEGTIMDIRLNDEQLEISRQARRFFENETPATYLEEMFDDERGFTDQVWAKMVEMGWTAMCLPEEYGGLGLDFIDLAVVLEEMGRAALPGPFFSTVLLAADAILEAGNDDQKSKYLPAIASGELMATLAVAEPEAGARIDYIMMEAQPQGDGFVLNGTKLFVPDAGVAGLIVAAARTSPGAGPEDGVTLFLVDPKVGGLTISALPIMDGTRKMSALEFKNVTLPQAAVLGEVGRGWGPLSRVLDRAVTGLAAENVGSAQKAMELATEYAKVRVQFDQPIGSFQAIKHRCAEMFQEVESARSLMYWAAWAQDHGEGDEAALSAAAVKSYTSEVNRNVTAGAVQVLGGTGFTWEHPVHFYLKRAKTNELLWGDPAYYRERAARLIID